ncbi:MAG: peptidylprolyl isomerase [Hyphomonadaceae bacterium]|nr:peptidylprolyl isomerase [Hyphomonadaceae bacterium]
MSAADKENTLILTLDTGPVTIQLLPDKAPGHVARIKELAREGFYDGVVFHRVIDGFMAQGGDPTGTGMGGSGEKLRAEFNDVSHQRGVCSMARSNDPNSGDSQFFICLDDASFLDRKYTAWGKVLDGMDSVDALPKGEPPKKPGKIISAKVAADA